MRVDINHPAFTRARAYLNGQDISEICFAADDREGWADCYVAFSLRKRELPMQERLRGRVELRIAEASR